MSRLPMRVPAVRSNLLRQILIAVGVMVVAAIVLESTGPFRNSQLSSMAYYAIAAIGLTLLTGLNGQISLGHGALMAVGAYTSALLLRVEEPWPFPLVALAAVVATTVVGFVVGLAAARFSGPYLAGATLALAVALPGIALYFSDSLGGEGGLTIPVPRAPMWFNDLIMTLSGNFGSGTKYVAYIGWAAFAVTLFFLLNLTRSHVGRRWRAVRDNDVAAELAGINLGRTRVQAFVVSAACAGLAGAVMALVVRLAAPSAFTIVLSLGLLTAIVIGGLGSMTGAVLGSAILVFLPGAVTNFATARGLSSTQAAQVAPFIYGIVLVLVILLAPSGLAGSLSAAYRRIRYGRPGPPSSRPRPAPSKEISS
ncbi:MAG: branched-chain amino acid ABC transporter permease [Nocardioidaceae bacterium]